MDPREYKISGEFDSVIFNQHISGTQELYLNERWKKVFGWPKQEDQGDSYIIHSPYGETIRIDFQRSKTSFNGATLSVYGGREQPVSFGISELETITGVKIEEVQPQLDTSLVGELK